MSSGGKHIPKVGAPVLGATLRVEQMSEQDVMLSGVQTETLVVRSELNGSAIDSRQRRPVFQILGPDGRALVSIESSR